MGRTRPPYPPEFRHQMVELVRVGRTPEELSREFEPSAQTIRNWAHQADLSHRSVPGVPRKRAPALPGLSGDRATVDLR